MTQRRIRIGFPASKFRTLATSPLAYSAAVQDSNAVYKQIQQTFDRVQVGFGSTSWLAADTALGDGSGSPGTAGKWTVNHGGDWLDASGTFNGTNHYISTPWQTNTNSISVDISQIDGDILIRGLIGWDSAQIDGVAAVSFVMDSSSAGSVSVPKYFSDPGIVLNPQRGNVLTLTRSQWQGNAQTLTVDKVAGPLIPPYPMGSTSNTPTVATLDLSSASALIAQVGSGNMAQPYAYNPEFITDPSTGLQYFRFTGGPTTGSRLISWFWHFGQSLTHAFVRYCLYVEDDVADGMTELGMKLPGLASNDGNNISLRTEHGPVTKVAGNRGLYKFLQYVYDFEESAAIKPLGAAMIRAGQWYVIEQECQLNTLGASDGVMRVWINDNQVYESTTLNFRGSNNWFLDTFHINVYHGGNNSPSQTIHERIAAVSVSTQRMGIPPELVANKWPAWRRNMTVGTFAPMPGYTYSNIPSVSETGVYTGLAVGPTAIYTMPGTGHWGNGALTNRVTKLDMLNDAPAWVVDCPPTLNPPASVTAAGLPRAYNDGKPAPSQTYHLPQFISGTTVPDGKDRLMQLGQYAVAMRASWDGNPYYTRAVIGYRTADKAWDHISQTNGPDGLETWADLPSVIPLSQSGVVDAATGVDPRTGYIYWSNGAFNQSSYIARFKPDTNTHEILWNYNRAGFPVTNINNGWYGWGYTSLSTDTKRNRIAGAAGIGNQPTGPVWLSWIDLGTMKWAFLTIGGITNSDLNSASSSAFCYDPDNDRFLLTGGNLGKVWSIDPVTGAATLLQAGLPAPSSNNIQAGGIENRMQYMSGLGGVVYYADYNSPIYFMPTKA